MHITYAMDRMEQFTISNRAGDPDAAAQMADAIAIMTEVRTTLMNHADQLSEPPGSS